ncbi:MAG: peptidylprolyl isomerase [Pseudomonadota bacterium]
MRTISVMAVFREPLVQFLLIGALLFAVDRVVALQADDPYQIIVDAEEISRLVRVFTEGQGRPPSEEEVKNLLVKWSQNEIFFREAKAMGLDRGDDMMRSRLILKMRNVIFNRVVEQAPEEDELRAWFELNQDQYDIPARYSVERIRVPSGSLADAEALAEELGTAAMSDRADDVQTFARRSRENLDDMLSQQQVDTLLAHPREQWLPVSTADKWSLMRISAVQEAIPANFEKVRYQVAKEFRKAASGLQVTEMAEEISDKYDIYIDFSEEDVRQIIAEASAYETPEITAQSRSLKARAGVADLGDEEE